MIAVIFARVIFSFYITMPQGRRQGKSLEGAKLPWESPEGSAPWRKSRGRSPLVGVMGRSPLKLTHF